MKKRFVQIIKKNRVISEIYYGSLTRLRAYLDQPDQTYTKIFSNVEKGELVVNINNIPGKYMIDSRSHILQQILLNKEYEPFFVELIKKHTLPMKDAINIGANIGLYTCLLANLIESDKKVLSIEPTPNAYKYLETNIKVNNYSHKVITYNGVASDKSGNFKINLIQGKEEYSSLGEIIHPATKDWDFTSIDVPGETIDNLVDKYNLNPGIIVIDVEGAEFQVLNGAINTIKKFKPIIISELDDLLLEKMNSTSNQIIQLLENIGYNVKDIENKKMSFPYSGNIIAFLP